MTAPRRRGVPIINILKRFSNLKLRSNVTSNFSFQKAMENFALARKRLKEILHFYNLKKTETQLHVNLKYFLLYVMYSYDRHTV